MEIEFEATEVEALAILARDEVESRRMTNLASVARFVQDWIGQVSAIQAQQLGKAVGLLAALDPNVVWPRDRHQLGKLVDAYHLPMETEERRRAFAAGLSRSLDELGRLDRRPGRTQIQDILDPRIPGSKS